MILRDFSDEEDCFFMNFPIPGPSGPQDPEKGRKIAKKVEKDRKNREKKMSESIAKSSTQENAM